MTNEELFLSTLKDLREKIDSGTEYNYIRACGLLRHLLNDNPSLVDLVNKSHKCKILFKIHINDLGPPLRGGGIFTSVQALRLDHYGLGSREVKPDAFLNTKVLRFNEHEYDVRNVIKSVAHILGGVHSGKSRDEKDEHFISLGQEYYGDIKFILLLIKSILNVTLDALKPLEQLIQERVPGTGLSP